MLREVGLSGQRALRKARVMVVGLGGLGCPVVQYLAAAGVGHLVLVDADRVSLSNLQRQILYTQKDVGELKVEVARGFVQRQNAQIEVSIHTEMLSAENATDLLALADIVVDCTDNFAARYLINDACASANKPWVYGSIAKFEGQVADILMKSRSAVKINLEELLVTHGMLGELLDGKTNDIYVCNTSSNSDNTGVSSGIAFFINSKGYLLTNNHVVEGCELQQVKYNDKDYEAKIIATDKTLDLALMKIEAKPKNYLKFSESSLEKLQKVYVAGYPFGKGLSDDLKISSGIVSSVKGYDDNSNEFQVDAPINPGNSGGPIVDDTGELIGIAVAGFAKDKSEGINFGIKSLSAVTFLKTNNIDPETSYMTFGMNNKKLLQLLEESTVYTYCN